MSVQLVVNKELEIGRIGGISDERPRIVSSKVSSVDIPFGRVLVRASGADEAAKLPIATDGVAQVETLTPTAQNTTRYAVFINGVEYAYTSDADATAAEIVTGLSSAINGGTVPVTASGSTTLILTADVAGDSFTIGATANLAIVHTTANVGVLDGVLGVSIAVQSLESVSGSDVPSYPAKHTINNLEDGVIYVYAEQDMGPTDKVFVRHTANGANKLVGQVRKDSDSAKAVDGSAYFKILNTVEGGEILKLKVSI